MSSKKFSRRILGDNLSAKIDYLRKPNKRNKWGGPFNGQRFRQKIFFDLMYYLPLNSIVETGTFKGTTTSLFASTSLPVYTVEANSHYYSFSKMRFTWNKNNIQMFKNDSRTFLKELSKNSEISKNDVFFYLDAHWKDDLPLREELEIIFENWKNPIVMVDDFCVPNTDYQFDDYGEGKVLNLNYAKDVIKKYDIQAFFPSVGAGRETGSKRGSVVFTSLESAKVITSEMSSLRIVE